MPTSKTNVLPLADYAVGSYALPSTAIPNNVIALGFSVARCTTATPLIWPLPSVQLNVALEVSLDNGVTWNPWGAYTAGGGIVSNRGQGDLAAGSISQSIPPGTNRRLRGTATVTGGVLRSSVDVTLTT